MAKPLDKPIIASSDVNLPLTGQPNKSKPAGNLLTVGYDKGQKPAAEEYNWLWDNVHDWVDYLEEKTETVATTTVQGIVELADNTEAVAGTDTVRAVTPAGVKSYVDSLGISVPSGSLIADGWWTDNATGLRLAWGFQEWTTAAGTFQTITFPTTFTAAFQVFTTGYDDTGGDNANNSVRNITTTQAEVWNPNGVSATNGVMFLVIGI